MSLRFEERVTDGCKDPPRGVTGIYSPATINQASNAGHSYIVHLARQTIGLIFKWRAIQIQQLNLGH